MNDIAQRRLVVAITGASGSAYARALLDALTTEGSAWEIHLIVSRAAMLVMKEELGVTMPGARMDLATFLGHQPANSVKVIQHSDGDLAAPPASGSFRHRGMIICPCSMKTLGSLAHGVGDSLITRAADACLKERRRLVVVPRETPLSLIHLRNMVALTEAGAVVLPAMPGFYHRPQSIDDLLRHLVLKMLDSLGVEHSIDARWKDRGGASDSEAGREG